MSIETSNSRIEEIAAIINNHRAAYVHLKMPTGEKIELVHEVQPELTGGQIIVSTHSSTNQSIFGIDPNKIVNVTHDAGLGAVRNSDVVFQFGKASAQEVIKAIRSALTETNCAMVVTSTENGVREVFFLASVSPDVKNDYVLASLNEGVKERTLAIRPSQVLLVREHTRH